MGGHLASFILHCNIEMKVLLEVFGVAEHEYDIKIFNSKGPRVQNFQFSKKTSFMMFLGSLNTKMIFNFRSEVSIPR